MGNEMKRLKILWLSHLIPYPPKGGVLQRSYNLIKELAKYHDVYLLAFNQKDLIRPLFDNYEEGIKEADTELNKFCKEYNYLPIPCDETTNGKTKLALSSLFSPSSYTINWLKSSEMDLKIKEITGRINFDIVHFDTISLAPYLNNFKNVKTVLDHHNIESSMLFTRTNKENNFIKKFYFFQEAIKLRYYEKKLCKKFDLNITCSDIDLERLLKISPQINGEVIPNGVDIEFFYPKNVKKDKNSLIFAGGLSWYPNADAMSYFSRQIWQKLKSYNPSVVMNVVGKSPSKELVELAKIDSNFKVHGFVDDVRLYIDKAQVYVCPIRDGGGTKLKILDALAMGSAVVAHPKSVEGIEVVDGESVLLAETPEQFCTQIQKLITNEELTNKLSENGRALAVEKYSYLEIGIKLANEMEKLMGENK